VSTAPELSLVSIDDYLRREIESAVKHEYLGGVVYAMSGGRNRHNLIATNTLLALGGRLRETACRAFNSDTKVRIRLPDHTRFYYPDVSVVCQQNSLDDVFQDRPVLVVEVLSESTRRTDLGEKAEAYQSIASLEVYLLVEQRTQAVVVFRRSEIGFEREVYEGLHSVVPLPHLGIELPLSEVYEALEFDDGTQE
jgi:Uma2 family endonuclease